MIERFVAAIEAIARAIDREAAACERCAEAQERNLRNGDRIAAAHERNVDAEVGRRVLQALDRLRPPGGEP